MYEKSSFRISMYIAEALWCFFRPVPMRGNGVAIARPHRPRRLSSVQGPLRGGEWRSGKLMPRGAGGADRGHHWAPGRVCGICCPPAHRPMVEMGMQWARAATSPSAPPPPARLSIIETCISSQPPKNSGARTSRPPRPFSLCRPPHPPHSQGRCRRRAPLHSSTVDTVHSPGWNGRP